MIIDYTDLEIGLYYRDIENYTVELRFRDPAAQTDEPASRGPVHFDFEKLREDQSQASAYGQRLTSSLFADANVKEAFSNAYRNSLEQEKKLRLRLYIDPEVPELHNLHWEMLQDPHSNNWLLTDEHILFSRFLRSSNSRSVKLRSKGELRALVFIANPSNLERDYHSLAQVKVAEERARANTGLGELIKEEIYSQEHAPGRATLNNLIDTLRNAAAQDKGYDILYIVCHGALRKKDIRDPKSPEEPYLLLEKEDGTADLARGVDLVSQLRGLSRQPWLVVLASCQSAGNGAATPAGDTQYESRTGDTRGALAALGPRLADAGVPAVLAMQGSILMETVAQFMPRFFKELSAHGQIDRAVGVARLSVLRSQRDWWVPTLFMRLREGRIWYEPGFRTDKFKKWPALLKGIRGDVKNERCTPILGAGLLDPLLGSSRELAHKWAQMYGFPMAPTSQEDLPQVAQYLTVSQAASFPYSEFLTFVADEIKQRYGSHLPTDLQEASADQLDQLVEAAADYLWQQNPEEPHLILAKLPLQIYITTNPDNLLNVALKKAGKEACVEVFHWKDQTTLFQETAAFSDQVNWLPTVQKPLMFHLFGHFQDPRSLVLTEDDYFDYLIALVRNEKAVPHSVKRAEADSTLMFLGFQLDDWNFRVLFRSILRHGGVTLLQRHTHVAVQIVPEDGRLLETERACQYLEEYFGSSKISIYWGSTEEFIHELRIEWNKLYGDKIPI